MINKYTTLQLIFQIYFVKMSLNDLDDEEMSSEMGNFLWRV
jgi:hypothetical protein